MWELTPDEADGKQAVRPIPLGMNTITPHLVIDGAAKAIDLYKKAFGAEEGGRLEGPDGKIMHAAIQVAGSTVFLTDEMPQCAGSKAPSTLGGTPVTLHLYVTDVDAAIEKAAKAGCTVLMPAADMFWGDRYGQVEDPFGHRWSIATHQRDLSPEEIAEGGRKMMAEFAQGKQ
ncbi:VOC family protein [Paracandidimonas lactea]|uniref:VOC family protein n=1 Tax=Paracandidimonas lactea TaxID=2895524 RepID=UPI001EF02452|nr:VOC family protein [Paracandidimonas lactea]